MAKMRVVQVPRPNGPLELGEREIPEPGTGFVRVKVEACGVCHNGKLVILGAADVPLEVDASLMIGGRRSIMGWPSGRSIDSQDTLAFSLLTGVRAMTETFPLERADDAYEHMASGKARFRAVLTTGR